MENNNIMSNQDIAKIRGLLSRINRNIKLIQSGKTHTKDQNKSRFLIIEEAIKEIDEGLKDTENVTDSIYKKRYRITRMQIDSVRANGDLVRLLDLMFKDDLTYEQVQEKIQDVVNFAKIDSKIEVTFENKTNKLIFKKIPVNNIKQEFKRMFYSWENMIDNLGKFYNLEFFNRSYDRI